MNKKHYLYQINKYKNRVNPIGKDLMCRCRNSSIFNNTSKTQTLNYYLQIGRGTD